MILGNDLIVSINGTVVAASRGCSLSMQQYYIPSCSPVSGRTRRKIPTYYEWSVSTDCLIANSTYADSIIDMLTAGTEVTLRWYDTLLNQKRKGQAIVSSVKQNAQVNSLSILSITFEGSGSLDKVVEYTNLLESMTEHTGHSLSCEGANRNIYIVTSAGDIICTKTFTVSNLAQLKLNARQGGCISVMKKTAAEVATIISTNNGGAAINNISIDHAHSTVYPGVEHIIVLQPGTYTVLTNKPFITNNFVAANLITMG